MGPCRSERLTEGRGGPPHPLPPPQGEGTTKLVLPVSFSIFETKLVVPFSFSIFEDHAGPAILIFDLGTVRYWILDIRCWLPLLRERVGVRGTGIQANRNFNRQGMFAAANGRFIVRDIFAAREIKECYVARGRGGGRGPSFAKSATEGRRTKLGQVVGRCEPELEGEGEGMEFGDAEVWQSLPREGCQTVLLFGRGCRFEEQQGFAQTRGKRLGLSEDPCEFGGVVGAVRIEGAEPGI